MMTRKIASGLPVTDSDSTIVVFCSKEQESRREIGGEKYFEK
jgi:hypothetical protein